MPPITELPCPRHRKHIGITQLLNQLQRLVGRKPCIRLDNHVLRPTRERKVLKHLPEQFVLVACALRVNDRRPDRHAKAFPTGNEQDHFKAKAIRCILIDPSQASERMLRATLTFQRRIADQVQHAI